MAEKNRRQRHLLMPCCSAPVTLKKSRQGTQFFAHKAIGACTTAPETEEHLRLKQLAVETARALGWEAETEIAHGALWRADVLATKGTEKIAIEIQWSQQTDEETLRRQDRYAASGVRGLWLLKQRSFASDPRLPAARVSAAEDRFLAHLPNGRGDQTLRVADFLGAALSGRLHYGLPLNLPAKAAINVGTLSCWSCGADTDILASIVITYGAHTYRFSVANFGSSPDLFATIREHLPVDSAIGIIRTRFSNTLQSSYLSNGCAHCDALIGQHYEHEAWYDQREVSSFSIAVDERWREALLPQTDPGWAVYAEESGA